MAYQKQIKEIQKKNTLFQKKLNKQEFLSKFRKTDRLTPIYTLVLYCGDTEWDAAAILQEIVDVRTDNPKLEKKLLELLPKYSIRVYDSNKHKEFHKFQTTLRTIFEFYSNRKDRNKLKIYMQEHMSEMKKLDAESKFLLATLLKERRLTLKLNESKERDEEEESDMCQAIEDMIQEGRMEGRRELLLEVLEALGEVNTDVKDKIMNENSYEKLSEWSKIVVKTNSLEAFKSLIC